MNTSREVVGIAQTTSPTIGSPMKNRPVNPAPHDCVSFRLQQEVAAELSAKAAKAGVSPNLLARDLMTEAMLKPAAEQQQTLEMVLGELGRIRTALTTANEHRQNAVLSAKEGDQIRTVLAAMDQQQQELKAWRQELLQLGKLSSEKDDRQRQLLETIKTELAGVRTALSIFDNERHALELLRAEVAKILADLSQVRRLRGDLATSVNVLLSNAGKVTPEQARAWVQQALLNPDEPK